MKEEHQIIGTRVSILSLMGNTGLFAVKLVAGVFGHSHAMLADSIHTLSNGISTISVLIRLHAQSEPTINDSRFSYTYLETVTSKIVALIIIFVSAAIGLTSITNTLSGQTDVPHQATLFVAILSIILKEVIYRRTLKMSKKTNSAAMKTDAWHHRWDALSSIVSFIGISLALLGFPIFDSFAGFIVSLMVIRTCILLYWHTIDSSDDKIEQSIIDFASNTALRTPGVLKVNEIHGHRIDEKVYLNIKLCVSPSLTVQEGHRIAHEAKKRILELNRISDVFIHVNPCYSIEKPDDSQNA